MPIEDELTFQALKALNFSAWNSRKEDMQLPYDDGAENFASYFKCHYKPLLDRLTDEEQKLSLSDSDKRLLSLLRDDLTAIFNA